MNVFGNQSKSYLERIARQGANSPTAFAHEVLTVTTASLSLVGNASATSCLIQVESNITTDAIRYWEDGTDPTATVGFYQGGGAVFELTSASNISNFKVIQGTAGTTKLNVTYYK